MTTKYHPEELAAYKEAAADREKKRNKATKATRLKIERIENRYLNALSAARAKHQEAIDNIENEFARTEEAIYFRFHPTARNLA